MNEPHTSELVGRIFLIYVHCICDLLSENLAHPEFYENRDKTRNRYIDV